MDAASSDKDLTRIINEADSGAQHIRHSLWICAFARQIGLLQKPGMEDQLLAEITGGALCPWASGHPQVLVASLVRDFRPIIASSWQLLPGATPSALEGGR